MSINMCVCVLLPYPAGLVRTELARSEDVKVVDNQISGVIASSDGCTCRFHAGMHMPCRHMFAMRRVCGLPPFDDTLAPFTLHNLTGLGTVPSPVWCNVNASDRARPTQMSCGPGPPRGGGLGPDRRGSARYDL